jgi:hypothetical protein
VIKIVGDRPLLDSSVKLRLYVDIFEDDICSGEESSYLEYITPPDE